MFKIYFNILRVAIIIFSTDQRESFSQCRFHNIMQTLIASTVETSPHYTMGVRIVRIQNDRNFTLLN